MNAARLAKLQQVAETVENFHNFFGPQLKKVIGDATSIDLMFARVTGLLTPLLELTFDVFDNSSEQVSRQTRTRIHTHTHTHTRANSEK